MSKIENILTKKRISFFVAETYPSYAGGGRNAFRFAQYLSNSGASASIYCLNYNGKLEKREGKGNLIINRILYYNKNLLVKLLSIPNVLFSYVRAVFKSEIILIYGDYLPGYYWILLLGSFLGKYTIFRSTLLGDDDIESIKKKPFWRIKKKAFNRLKLYFAINEEFKNSWIEQMGDRIPVFMHQQGVDSEIFNTNIRKNNEHNRNEVPVLLTNAILIERKGYRKLFEALTQVKANFRFIVIGQYLPDKHHRSSAREQKEMRELYELGQKLLGENIEFVNTLEDITPLLAKSAIFIYGGSQDGTPNAVLEAMAVGLPVLMYNSGVNDSIFIANDTVLQFNSFEEMPDILDSIIDNHDLLEKIGQNAAQSIRKNYTFDQVVTRLSEIISCSIEKQ